MSTADLRLRILLALGLPTSAIGVLPACKDAPPPEAPVAPVPSASHDPRPAASAASPHRACAVDEVLERVCGQMKPARLETYPFPSCGRSASEISRHMDQRTIERRTLRVGRDELDAFAFDPDETLARLKESLSPMARTVGEVMYRSSLCCYTRCTRLDVAQSVDPILPGHDIVPTCLPAPQRTSLPADGNARCPAAVHIRGTAVRFHHGRDNECCYATTLPSCGADASRGDDGQCHHHNRGRPFREGDRVIAAFSCTREGWSTRAGDGRSIRSNEASRGATLAWTRNAAAEHASIATFARLSLELLSLGAPADLIAACHVAALEEIEHARLSYDVASQLAGELLGPGPVPLQPSARRIDLAALVRETFRDGCLGETIAALEAAEARGFVADDAIASALAIIARDEASHAALAFRILAWALRTSGPPVRSLLEALVSEVEGELGAETHGGEEGVALPGELARWGILSDRALGRLRTRAIREVVAPCARALLAEKISTSDPPAAPKTTGVAALIRAATPRSNGLPDQ